MDKQRKKILIADPDKDLHQLIKKSKNSSHYHFESAYNGAECLAKLDHFQPDLIIMELMLPVIHGIEILRRIKIDPRTKETGVILISAHAMIQNYNAAINHGCDYFLEKPFEISELTSLLKRFFEAKLYPDPYSGKDSVMSEGKYCYLPKRHSPNSYIKFWGTRGSNPVSGSDYIRFGGNTSTLEVRNGDDLIIIDAGTGIRPLGNILQENPPKHIHLLLSHTHWDHLAGFPFFAPIYNPNCHLTIWSPIGFEKSAKELFTEMLAYAYFPVRLDDIQATITFKEIHESVPFTIGDFEIDTHYAYHPGATVCFKIKHKKFKFGYATDNELLMGYHGNPNSIGKSHAILKPYRSQIQFFKDCDLLIHEAQYTPIEYQSKVGWGHSSIANVAALIKHADVRDWIITHHDPKHTDADLFKKIQLQNDILHDCKLECHSRMAFDGFTIPL